jgi:hypothetical protein
VRTEPPRPANSDGSPEDAHDTGNTPRGVNFDESVDVRHVRSLKSSRHKSEVWFDREDLQRIVYQNTLQLQAQRSKAYILAKQAQRDAAKIQDRKHQERCHQILFGGCETEDPAMQSGPTSETEESLTQDVSLAVDPNSIFQ